MTAMQCIAAKPVIIAALIGALGPSVPTSVACVNDTHATSGFALGPSRDSAPTSDTSFRSVERQVLVPAAFGRRYTPLDMAPRPVSLVEVLYEATRVLDAGSTALAAIEAAYAEFGVQWRTRLPPKYARLAESDATADTTPDATTTTDARGDDAIERAQLRALKAAWAEADTLHAMLAERVIASCVEAGIERARDPVAQANFRGRLAHRTAFSDGECAALGRLPILTTPCVDLAIALLHPRVMQRVPAERRATVEALLAAEWPRIVSEHQSVRRIGFELAEAERRAERIDGHTAGPIGNAAAIEACASIARLVRANLDANMRFAAQMEAEVGVDAADALRVELIANACRDGHFASGISDEWASVERLLRRIREDRGLDETARASALRLVREERGRYVAECVTAYRSVLADERCFSPGIDLAGRAPFPLEGMDSGETSLSDELHARFVNLSLNSSDESLAVRLRRAVGIAPLKAGVGADQGDAFVVEPDTRSDGVRLFRANSEDRFANEDDAGNAPRANARDADTNARASGANDGKSQPHTLESDAFSFAASDLRRVGAALWLDGIDRSRQEIEPVLDACLESCVQACLQSYLASRPAGDASASTMFAHRREERALGARGRNLEAWRELPDIVRRERAFDDARAKVLAAA
ncbi:MAG: hypothetical protein RL591_2641, partial [Planctomycetota bacterium]